MTIALETGPIGRFASPGDYASYCRCVRTQRLSNGKSRARAMPSAETDTWPGPGSRRRTSRFVESSRLAAAPPLRSGPLERDDSPNRSGCPAAAADGRPSARRRAIPGWSPRRSCGCHPHAQTTSAALEAEAQWMTPSASGSTLITTATAPSPFRARSRRRLPAGR
ncbi:MAG: hypothetical protein NDJ92_07270 [Thermoanaerobaculia bacterium]|nr:hypothetical protein [Thermoanaerobaculia bacterium]